MSHIVLLGDSIFANAAYVAGGPDVVRQLQQHLPQDWRATLLAVDGAVTSSVTGQLAGLPQDATHLVVSTGGNDALRYSSLLERGVRSVAEGVLLLADARAQFAQDYRRMVEQVMSGGLPVALCTIYDANYPELQQRIVSAALSLFNDVITRQAFARRLPLIDLRLICTEAGDYANPIEPSVQGGGKIATAISALVSQWPEHGHRSVVVTEP